VLQAIRFHDRTPIGDTRLTSINAIIGVTAIIFKKGADFEPDQRVVDLFFHLGNGLT